MAFALAIGDGCAAFLSICQGQKDTEGSRYSVGNAIVMLLAISIIYTLLLVLFQNPILKAFGATENNLQLAIDYYKYILIGIPFFIFTNGLNSVIRADGDPKFAMISTLIGAIVNLVLDPVAIFLLGWGMQGAAIATVIGQIVSACLSIWYIKHAKTFKLNRRCFALKWKIIKRFLPLGISSFLTQLSIVVIMAVMNNMLVRYGAQSRFGADIPLTVVGIVMKLFQIVISVVVGIAVGCQPIIGYNYGAKHYRRVHEIYKKMIVAEIIVGIIATFVFELFPHQVISIFGSESDLYNEFAVLAFRIYLCTILLTCVQKSTSIFLQALGKPVMSMALSLFRDFFLIVPLVLFLPIHFGVVGTLYSAPIADVISLVAVVIFTRKVVKELRVKDTNQDTVTQ